VLVVVRLVSDVAMGGVHVVHVPVVLEGGMPAPGAVDVHVPKVQVMGSRGRALVNVVAVRVVHFAVVEEVHVPLVGDRGMPAEAVVAMRVRRRRVLGRRVCHSRPR
jgi:hypothetical protein